ncbi:MAG: 16S rRNA (adenine(1518)-N(6)/adenine(1519)-N(6))-dimethyltransferase RsmA [Acidibacillus sp.]|nr:16S rRNA (adenine(1518)-N(6)/adenine(1519)-N(6))-dimethyltransferase RsmA [Acidibacillus sp.]
MKQPLYQPRIVSDLLKRHSFVIKKSLGQNFLVDGHILDSIVDAALEGAPSQGTKIAIEIGPGIGTLTQALVEGGFDRVITIEKDKRLQPLLQETLGDYEEVDIRFEDALQFDFEHLFSQLPKDATICFAANLPYYITTPLIMHVVEYRLPFSRIVVMVQKEVAERMVARPGGKDYGALSVAVQYYCQAKIVTVVPGTCFMPKPDVESAVISLERIDHGFDCDQVAFFRVVRGAFAKRRKTLENTLAMEFGLAKPVVRTWLQTAGIDGMRRGETLSLQEFALLSKHFEQFVSSSDRKVTTYEVHESNKRQYDDQ